MIAQDVINKVYGVNTYENSQAMNDTVGTTITQIVAGDPGAVGLILNNLGTSDMYVWVDESVSTTKGMLIPANGGNLFLDVFRHFLMPTRPLYAVTASGTTQIAVLRQSILSNA